jgi:hypothetical protein
MSYTPVSSETPISEEEEARMIRSQIEMMEKQIQAAQDRLGKLESNQD